MAVVDKTLEEIIPNGVTKNCTSGKSYPSDHFAAVLGVEPGKTHTSTFAVEPNHERLRPGAAAKNDGSSHPTTGGVCFNVETVPDPLPHHMKKPVLERCKMIQHLRWNLAKHYNNNAAEEEEEQQLTAKDIYLEAVSETSDTTSNHKVAYVGGNGFIMAVMTAFAQHLPLILSPDHIWILISYAFAQHVEKHAEELRRNFVQHEGKKRLSVVTPDNFRMSTTEQNPDTGATAQEWETSVFPEFSSQITDYIGESIHKAITSEFTTTTPTAQACHEITLMSAMKHYFNFGMTTACGIPNITLLGEEEDWVNLRARAEQLGTLMTPQFQQYWMPLLLPVLDEFVNSYRGEVKHGFWQSMVKLRNTRGGSGAHDFVSGWVQILFPYSVTGYENPDLRPWHELYFKGPLLEEFPPIVSTAPVDWEYQGRTLDMTFHAGILGFTQVERTDNNDASSMEDAKTGALCPLLGWYVLHDPPKSLGRKLQEYTQERNDLVKAHKEEAAASVEIKERLQAPWYVRVKYLEEQINLLQDKLKRGG